MKPTERPPGQQRQKPATRLIETGRSSGRHYGFVNLPTYRGSTVLFSDTNDLANRHSLPFTYGRPRSPTHQALEEMIQALSGGAGVILAPSGLAAITLSITALLKNGDHLIVADTVYGPTRIFCQNMLPRWGIEVSFVDPTNVSAISNAATDYTRAIFLESPGSITMEVYDIPAICALAQNIGAWTLLDNTWATPLNFSAHEKGIDVEIHAATKYFSGHADVLLGAFSCNEATWQTIEHTNNIMGSVPGCDETTLCIRGMRTLPVRLAQIQSNANAVMEWFSGHSEECRILHPSQPDHPGHEFYQRDFNGGGGLFSIEFHSKSEKSICAFVDSLTRFGIGFSWGGYESLAIPLDLKAFRSPGTLVPEGRCIRFYIGLEEPADLIADLEHAWSRLDN